MGLACVDIHRVRVCHCLSMSTIQQELADQSKSWK
jgi:hypothetical protein